MPDRQDPLALQMRQQFMQMAIEQTRFWVDFVAPPDSRQRGLILHETLTEEEEWYLLEETHRKWLLWQAGELEQDSDIVNFDQNVDDAQSRFIELRQEYGDDPEVIDG